MMPIEQGQSFEVDSILHGNRHAVKTSDDGFEWPTGQSRVQVTLGGRVFVRRPNGDLQHPFRIQERFAAGETDRVPTFERFQNGKVFDVVIFVTTLRALPRAVGPKQ